MTIQNTSVLVVDDQPENIKTITGHLRELGIGSKIYSCPNGELGLKLAEKYQPDLILTDWEMPVLDGLEMTKRLKANPITADIPIIMITAVNVQSDSMKTSFDAGVHDYLRKPYSKLEFFARVRGTIELGLAYQSVVRAKGEIATQAALMAKQNQQLQKLATLRDHMLAVISHDVRAPLNNLAGLIHIMNDMDPQMDKSIMETHFDTVAKDLESVSTFLDDLLTWSKAQMENKGVVRERIQMSQIVEKILTLFEARFMTKKLNFLNEIDDDLSITGDKDVVYFILRNLVDNGIKYTPEGGRIKITSQDLNGRIVFAVNDSGIGMSQKLIDDFHQNNPVISSRGTHGEKGIGIGLKICKDFAENNQLSLTVRSEVNVGTTFELSVPKD